ncbi:MAG: DUF134 domain-containing protein [Bacteroidota bacterium]
MSRPKKYRNVRCDPAAYYFKPRGIPLCELEEVVLEADELEALRLADHLGLTQQEAAFEMKISRATFGRIIGRARKKTAESLVNGKAIKICLKGD